MDEEEEEAGPPGEEAETDYEEAETDTPPAPPMLEVRRPAPYPTDAASVARLKVQAGNILENMSTLRGIKTYKTTWTSYEAWHHRATGEAVPRCELTGLMWVDVRQGTYFVTDMAACGKTIDQVCAPLVHHTTTS